MALYFINKLLLHFVGKKTAKKAISVRLFEMRSFIAHLFGNKWDLCYFSCQCKEIEHLNKHDKVFVKSKILLQEF